ncbi:MAG: phosphoenolpyruvate--protein phosphotransferase [Bacteroidota bacterium]
MMSQSVVFSAITGNDGVAIGVACVLPTKNRAIPPSTISKEEVNHHVDSFRRARSLLSEEISDIAQAVADTSTVDILAAQDQILQDPEIEESVIAYVKGAKYSARYAIYLTFCEVMERMRESGSEMLIQRIVDLEDIRDRLVVLASEEEQEQLSVNGFILVAREISPTDLVTYYEGGIKGLVLEKGGITSHAAIIARSLQIPCLVGVKGVTAYVEQGSTLVMDGPEGKLIANPGKDILREYERHIEHRRQEKKRRRAAIKAPSQTMDGVPFKLLANLEFEEEVGEVASVQAEGIGLLRTEGLLFKGERNRNETIQTNFYRSILSSIKGICVIRLFDIGGDKLRDKRFEEANPFLGWRGVRLLLDEKELLHAQLRAIVRVSAEFPERVRLLIPMVTVPQEVVAIKDELQVITTELANEGIHLKAPVPVGVMIEVPSVALQASLFGKHADFFSFGTNDLTQYTLAADRGNERVCQLYQLLDPSVFKLIHIAIEGAKQTQTPLCVCGEVAGDPIGAAVLVGLGINELSMVPVSVPKVKEMLISYSHAQLQHLAREVLTVATAAEVKTLFHSLKNTKNGTN